jgi:hypothetical protein
MSKAKTLVPVLILLALGSIGAGRALAEAPNFFTAASYPTSLSGSSQEGEEWTFADQAIACEDASFSGVLREKATTVKLVPAYEGCTAFGFPATVAMNGCDYLLELWPGSITGGSVALQCPEGREVTIETEFGLCPVSIPPHPKEASFEAREATPQLGLNLFVSNITARLRDVGGFLCPLERTATVTEGSYIGAAMLGGSSPIAVR